MALIFARERFPDVEAELRDLIVPHWHEVGDHRDTLKLDVDWAAFRSLEDKNMLLVVTARHDCQLVGYVIHVIAPSLHYRPHLIARDDAHYLAPEHRKGWNAIRLLRAAEKELVALGVSAISYHQKEREDLNKGIVFKRLGYEPRERIYTKYM